MTISNFTSMVRRQGVPILRADMVVLVTEEYLMIILGYSYFSMRGDASNKYPQHIFLCITGENYPRIITKYSSLTSPLSIGRQGILNLWYNTDC